MRRAILAVVGCIAAVVAGLSCSRGGPAQREPGPVRVVVSVPPLAGLVRALAPGAEVRALIAPGRSPHGYEATPADLAALARADLVLLVGLGLDSGVPASARKHEHMHEMSWMVGIREEAGAHEGHAHEGDDHGHDHGHAHGAVDPHLWLDPELVARLVPELAAALRNRLTEIGAPREEVEAIDGRAESLVARVREVDGAYASGLAGVGRRAIIVHHNAWSRPAARYGLEIAGVIELAEGVEPSIAHLARLAEAGRAAGVGAVVTEPQLAQDLPRRVSEMTGAPLVTLDPLGDGDWEAMMRANLSALLGALGEGEGAP